MAKERAVAARRALPIVPRLGQVALGELVSGILTLQLLDDITNARALVYFGQSSRDKAELGKEYFSSFSHPVAATVHQPLPGGMCSLQERGGDVAGIRAPTSLRGRQRRTAPHR